MRSKKKLVVKSVKRNLLYNCCPLARSDEWRANVEWLGRYAEIFNGRKLVIMRTGEGLVDPEEVERSFPFEVEFVRLPNDPTLKEVSGFIDVLAMLESKDANEATFYGHTKGVSHSGKPTLESVRQWRNRMYYECLRDPERIDQVMSKHPTAGCFIRHSFERPREWIFAGTFYWLNHERLFSRPNWREMSLDGKLDAMSIERYPSVHFRRDEAFSLYDGPLRFYHYAFATFRCRKCGNEMVFDESRLTRKRKCGACYQKKRGFERLYYTDMDVRVER